MAFVNGTKIVALYDDNGRLSGANSEQPNRIAIAIAIGRFIQASSKIERAGCIA